MERIKNIDILISKNNFKVVALIISVAYIILAIAFKIINDALNIGSLLLISLIVLIALILIITTYVVRLKLTYLYHSYIIILLYVLTYFILPILIFDDINYVNFQLYIDQYLNFINTSNFYVVIIINLNIIFLPIQLSNMLKNTESVLHLNDNVHLISNTDTYVKTFDTKEQLHTFIEYLNNCESSNTLPLNKFDKIDDFEGVKTNNIITLQVISFKDCNYFKIKITYKTNLTKLITLDLYSGVYELEEYNDNRHA